MFRPQAKDELDIIRVTAKNSSQNVSQSYKTHFLSISTQ